MARIVRRTESTYLAMSDAEARARHAATCGDGQYVGPYANDFTLEWCKLVYGGGTQLARPFGQFPTPSAVAPVPQPPPSAVAPVPQPPRSASAPASVGAPVSCLERSAAELAPQLAIAAQSSDVVLVLDASCEFHLSQGVGRFVDRRFPAVAQFECLLREAKDEFGDGASRVYLRASARSLGKRVRALLAPKVDNFKVTLYSRAFHTRFLYNYDLLYKSLAAKLSATYQNEVVLAWSQYEKALQAWERRGDDEGDKKKKPSPPSASRGLRVKACRVLRSLGQRLTDPFLVVFSVGRGDLRDLFLSAYATITQNYKLSGLVKARCRDEMCSAMRSGVHSLAQLAGSLRCLNYAANVHKPGSKSFDLAPKRWKLGAKALRLHVKVICAHFGWRFIPNVVRILPEILIPVDSDRTIMGMSIKPGIRPGTSPFKDPMPKKVRDRAAYRAASRAYETPSHWWFRVIDALDQLVRFLRLELIHFQDRLQSWDSERTGAGTGLRYMPFRAPSLAAHGRCFVASVPRVACLSRVKSRREPSRQLRSVCRTYFGRCHCTCGHGVSRQMSKQNVKTNCVDTGRCEFQHLTSRHIRWFRDSLVSYLEFGLRGRRCCALFRARRSWIFWFCQHTCGHSVSR